MAKESPEKEPSGDSAPSESQLGKLLLIGAALTAIVVLFIVLLAPSGEKLDKEGSGRIHSFVVPAGTAERLAKGEKIEIVPRTLDVKVGDTMIIKNEDSKTHTVGPVVVRAGETAEQNFTRTGVVEGECTVHPDDKFTIRISE